MPDDHSKLVPPLPIPNRTVKRLRADDSAATSVKVGHRQASIKKPSVFSGRGFLLFELSKIYIVPRRRKSCVHMKTRHICLIVTGY
jgi:hypothetical protein